MTAERNAAAGSPETIGFVATLAGLHRAQGSRARWMFCALVVLLAFAVSASAAFAERSKLPAITEANGSPFGGLNVGLGVGLSTDSADNLWVVDSAGQVVDKFDSSGAFLTQSAGPWTGLYPGSIAYSNASKHLYLDDYFSGDVWGIEPGGEYANIDLTGPWDSGCCVTVAVAADNSAGATGGDLYLAAGEGATVYRIDGAGSEKPFSASEPYINEDKLTGFASGESFANPVAVAVDNSGDLYVADAGRDAVYEFKPSGEFVHAFTEAHGKPFASVNGVAVDPSNGHVVIADSTNGFVDEFDSTGTYLDNIEELNAPSGLVVDSTGKLYVTEGNQVGVYGTYGPHIPRQPKITAEAVSGLGLNTVTLNATVNPKEEGEVSECRFEYGTSEAFGHSVPCEPATFSNTTTVSAEVSGLAPDTFYYYRLHVIDPATGAGGASEAVESLRTFTPNPVPAAGPPTTGCPNEAARQGPSATLTDCRAYEQVSPVNKGIAEDMFSQEGQDIFSFGFSSEEGNQFLLTTFAALGDNPAANENGYVAARTGSGWSLTSLAVPGFGAQSIAASDRVFNPFDLSEIGFQDALGSNPEHLGPEGKDAMVIGPPGGPDASLSVAATTGSEVVGASRNLGHVLIGSANHDLAPGDTSQAAGKALYDWSSGHLTLVNVNTDGSLVSPCGAMLGSSRAGTAEGGGTAGAVSADGSKIFFTAPDPTGPEGEPGCWAPGKEEHWGVAPEVNPPQLYMRATGTTTVKISTPTPGVKDATPYAAVYAGASADGSRVFFLSRGELTADDPGHATELYEYDTLTSTLTRISRGDAGDATGAVGFVGAISSDGSTVYFGAGGDLAPGAPAGGGLYRYDTLSRHTSYIAPGAEYPLEYGVARTKTWKDKALLRDSAALDDRADWYTTPNGKYLVFPSRSPITGYDSTQGNDGNCEGACVELFRYDASHNSIVCVSCGATPPVDDALFARAGTSVGPQSLPPRPISEDGADVFFDTASALVPRAKPGETHVYEWHDGAIALLSPSNDPYGSFFLGTSADGANVFIGTHAQLVAQDTDNAGDLYDARVDGGFGGAAPPVCTRSGCQGVPPASSTFATPSSATFEGHGNLPPGVGGGKPKTNADRLAEALKACRKRYRNTHKRARCAANARRRYPVAHKTDTNTKNRGGK